jgi:hypothetical protein
VAYATLAVLLVVVARGVDARAGLAVAIIAASVALVSGAISLHGARGAVDELAPTLGFLAANFTSPTSTDRPDTSGSTLSSQ